MLDNFLEDCMIMMKRGKRKRNSISPCSSSSDPSKKIKPSTKSNVSHWGIYDLQRVGIHYEQKAVSLSGMLETVKLQSKGLIKIKPFPSFMSSLEEYTKQALNFSLLEYISTLDTLKSDLQENVYSKMQHINCLIWKIRKEEDCLEDELNRDLFEMWSGRIRDFMHYYKRFLEDQSLCIPRTDSRFVQLFMAFSRIFFLNPELGDNEKKIVHLGRRYVSCTPSIRFPLAGVNSLHKTVAVILNEWEERAVVKEEPPSSSEPKERKEKSRPDKEVKVIEEKMEKVKIKRVHSLSGGREAREHKEIRERSKRASTAGSCDGRNSHSRRSPDDHRDSKRRKVQSPSTSGSKVNQIGLIKNDSADSEEKFDLRNKLPDRILGQHGGELLAEKESSALAPVVIGAICLGTKIIFTCMDMSLDHYLCIKERGKTKQYSSMIAYTKPYNFLLEKDRNELLPFLFYLGYVQSVCFRNLHR